MARVRTILGLALGGAAGGWVGRLRPFRVLVRGDSMLPGLRPGDQVIAVRSRPPRRGELVVVRPPGRDLEMVKRLVGLPGERVRLDGEGVRVDGTLLEEPWATGGAPPAEWRLGTGEYLVLGDNRGRSTDGRSFGPLREEHVVGRVVARYWPRVGIVGRGGWID